MKYINGNILCLEYAEFVPIIMAKPAYDQAKLRGNLDFGQGNLFLQKGGQNDAN